MSLTEGFARSAESPASRLVWGLIAIFCGLGVGLASVLSLPAAVGAAGAVFTWLSGGWTLLLLLLLPVRVPSPVIASTVGLFEVALVILAVRELAYRRRSHVLRIRSSVTIPVSVFFALAAASTIWSADVTQSVRALIQLGEVILAVVLTRAWAIRTGRARVLAGFVGLGLAGAFVAVVWRVLVGAGDTWLFQALEDAGRIRSSEVRLGSPLWGSSSYFASMLLLFLFSACDRSVRPWLRRVAVTVCGAAMVLTLSRGAILSVAMGLLLWVALNRRAREWLFRNPWRAFAVGAVVTSAGVFGSSLVSRFMAARPSLQGLLADEARVNLFQLAIELWSRRPVLGHGFGTWSTLVPPEAATGAHNYVLQLAVELGVVGVLAFCGLYVVLIRAMWRHSVALAAGAFAVFVNALVEASLEGVLFSWMFGLFVGIGLSPREQEAGDSAVTRMDRRVVR